jgi:hypothetical protein
MLDWLDKLTFKDIFQLIKDWSSHLLKKWYWLLLFVLAGAGYGYYKTYKIPTTYSASITFVLSTETKTGGTGISGLAAQFGLEAGTGGSESVFSGDNIIELFKTRKIAERALLQTVPGTNKNFLRFIHEDVKGKTSKWTNFPASVESLTPEQLHFLRSYTGLLSGKVSVFKKDKKLSYYTITATGTHEKLVYYTAQLVLQETSNFFTETKTKVARKNLELLQKEADSLYGLLSGAVTRSASIADNTFNLNPSLIVQRAPVQVNQAKTTALTGAYTEVMRQLEVAKINIQKETPLYQIIDEPILPLAAQKPDILSASVQYATMGFVLGVVLLLVGFYWKEINRIVGSSDRQINNPS